MFLELFLFEKKMTFLTKGGINCIMQKGVFITPQEAMEPVLNEALIDYESRLWLKAVKIKLSVPQQIVEEHEHVRDANQLGARHDLHRPRTTHKRLQEARS